VLDVGVSERWLWPWKTRSITAGLESQDCALTGTLSIVCDDLLCVALVTYKINITTFKVVDLML